MSSAILKVENTNFLKRPLTFFNPSTTSTRLLHPAPAPYSNPQAFPFLQSPFLYSPAFPLWVFEPPPPLALVPMVNNPSFRIFILLDNFSHFLFFFKKKEINLYFKKMKKWKEITWSQIQLSVHFFTSTFYFWNYLQNHNNPLDTSKINLYFLIHLVFMIRAKHWKIRNSQPFQRWLILFAFHSNSCDVVLYKWELEKRNGSIMCHNLQS